jgi:carotenoid cleavage dioxygenase
MTTATNTTTTTPTMTTQQTNPYLEGNYAPVREERAEANLEVTGTIPDYLDGRYLRIGPNPVTNPDPARYHWFMGTGMVHGLRLRDGGAEWYRNRYVRSKDVSDALGESPHPGPVFAGFDLSPNTNVIGHAGRTFALVEAGGRPYELDEKLGTIGPCDFDGTLPGGYTAHPLLDPATGELHAVSYFFGWGNQVQYSVIDPAGRVRRTVDITVGASPMMHAFSLTERYVVIYDLPVTFDGTKAAATGAPRALRKPVAKMMDRTVGHRRIPDWVVAATAGKSTSSDAVLPYSWNPEYPARIGVMPRDGGDADVQWIDIEPCYVYHPVNAYDDGDRIVLDVVRHPKMFATEHRGPYEGLPSLDRWTLDLGAGRLHEERLDDTGQEFPRIDERLTGRRHRFGYTVGYGETGGGTDSHALIRQDFEAGTSVTRDFGPAGEPGEFVFIPARPDSAEDDGVLMGLVYDGEKDTSDLVIVDSATLETVAAAHLPVRVPHGFHGNWVPTA